MNSKEIGKRLKILRGAASQKEVANALKIAPSTYAMYESGGRIPRDEIKIRIADYFRVSIESIFFAD